MTEEETKDTNTEDPNSSNKPPPDLADLQAQLATATAERDAATAAASAGLEATRAVLKAANPTLDDNVFEADTVQGLMTNMSMVEAGAKAALDAAAASPDKPALGFHPAPAERQPAKPPDGLTGFQRIVWGLENQ